MILSDYWLETPQSSILSPRDPKMSLILRMDDGLHSDKDASESALQNYVPVESASCFGSLQVDISAEDDWLGRLLLRSLVKSLQCLVHILGIVNAWWRPPAVRNIDRLRPRL